MKLRVLTGLHIGGNNDSMKIGGIDSEVIKREIYVYKDSGDICYVPEFDNNGDLKEGIEKIEEPYIPGSSIKGKVRSLLEHSFGLIRKQKMMYQDEKEQGQVISSRFIKDCSSCSDEDKKLAQLIIDLFGESAGNENRGFQITRAIFRDAFITKEIRKAFIDGKFDLSEEKAENTINRVTSMANPRFMERVPAGVEFEFDYVIRDFLDDDKRIELFKKTIELGLLLLQNDALGGGGSRGNGRVCFDIFDGIEDIQREIKNRMKEIKDNL